MRVCAGPGKKTPRCVSMHDASCSAVRDPGVAPPRGLRLRVRDAAEFSIRHQLLIYPMLDDTNSTRSSEEVTDLELWNRANNEIAWRAYLGDAYGTDAVSPYAAPTRAKQLARRRAGHDSDG
jgi:hypothetical protein